MTSRFQFAVALALLLIALAALRSSENGRYRYFADSKDDENHVVLDTRTGEYWETYRGLVTDADPQAHRITYHLAHESDATALDACMDGKSQNWLLHPAAMYYCRTPKH